MLPNEFYFALGNLLYAIAISDSEVQIEEIEEFHKISFEELKKTDGAPAEEADHFNSLLLDSGFITNYNTKTTADEALNNFISYYNSNIDIFKDWVKEFCLSSVIKMAESFDGIVTEEKDIILRLKDTFDKS